MTVRYDCDKPWDVFDAKDPGPHDGNHPAEFEIIPPPDAVDSPLTTHTCSAHLGELMLARFNNRGKPTAPASLTVRRLPRG